MSKNLYAHRIQGQFSTGTNILRGQYLYIDASSNVDTTGDWRIYADASIYYTQYCSSGNSNKGSGTWVTKGLINSINNDISLNSYATYTDIQRKLLSCGPLTDASITDLGNGLVNISSIDVHLNTSSDFTGNINRYTIPALNSLQLTANTYTYIIANYNNGTPIYQTTLDNNIVNHSTILNIAQLYWENVGTINELRVFKTGQYGLGLTNKVGHRLIHTERFGYESGLGLSEYGTRNIRIETGKLWYDGNEINTILTTSASTGHEMTFYYPVSGVYTASKITQYPNTQYSDGSNLQTLTNNNKYTNAYVFKSVSNDNKSYLLLGSEYSSVAAALAAKLPALPDIINKQAKFLGRLVIQKNAATASQITSELTNVVGQVPIVNHNDTANKQGGDLTSNLFYHSNQPINTTDTPVFYDVCIGSLNRTISEVGADTRMNTGIPYAERSKFKLQYNYDGSININLAFNGANTSFNYYINDKKFRVGTIDISKYKSTVTKADGVWFFYINHTTTDASNPNIVLTQTPWAITDPDVLLYNFYFNASTNQFTWIGEERHTAGRDIYNHARNHAQGAIYRSGLLATHYNGLTTFTNNDNNYGRAQIQIGNGTFFDEDILLTITHSDTAINASIGSPEYSWNMVLNQFLGFTEIATTGTTTTQIVFPNTHTLKTGQSITVMQGNTTTIRGTITITTGGTGTTFATSTLAGMTSGDALVIGAQIPIFYVSNVSNGVYSWSKLPSSEFLGVSLTTGQAYTTTNISTQAAAYNNAISGGLLSMTSGRYYPIYLIATNSIYEPIIAILGQGQSTNATLATALGEAAFQFGNLLGLSNMGIQEIVPFYRLTFEYNTGGGFSNSRIRLRDVSFLNLRVASLSGQVVGAGNNSIASSMSYNDTTNFNGWLSTSDTNVQLALNTLDDTFRKLNKTYQVLNSSTNITFDVSVSLNAKLLLRENAILSFNNLINSDEGNLIIIQDASGSRTLSITPTPKVINGGNGSLSLTSTANATDILNYMYDGSTLYLNIDKNFT